MKKILMIGIAILAIMYSSATLFVGNIAYADSTIDIYDRIKKLGGKHEKNSFNNFSNIVGFNNEYRYAWL